MKLWTIGFGIACVALLLLNGCGSGGGAQGGQTVVLNERIAVLRVIDAQTKGRISGVEVYFVTDQGTLPWRRVVGGATTDPNKISLNIARSIKNDLQEGDFVIRNLPNNLQVRGIWIRRPNGYTAVVKHVSAQNIERVVQLPDTPNTLAACLIAPAVDLRPLEVIDLGRVELYPNSQLFPPPPVDEQCP